MDHLDTRILRLLLGGGQDLVYSPDFRRSFRAMAKELEVNEGTVRNRVKHLMASGFIGEWRLRTNPQVWGGREAGLWLDLPFRLDTDRLLGQLLLVPGVNAVTCFYPSFVTLLLRYAEEPSLRNRVELIRRIARPHHWGLGELVYPECDLVLTNADWEVLRSVERDPRKPYGTIADELGLSRRTVQGKLRRLIRGHAVFAYADLDVEALHGAVMASTLVGCGKEEHREAALRLATHLDPYLWRMSFMRPLDRGENVTYGFDLMLPNVPTSRTLVRWIRKQPGVAEARIDFLEEIVTPREPFDVYARTSSESAAVAGSSGE